MTNSITAIELDETLNDEIIVDRELLSDEIVEPLILQTRYVKHSIFKPSIHQAKKIINKGENMVFENPYEAKDPQEVLKQYGIRRSDSSMFPNNTDLPKYGDFSEFQDFGDRVNLYLNCKDQFEALPSEIRKEFNHDLGNFTKYVTSKDFDITRLMTSEYKKDVYEPMIKKQKHDKAYAEYIKNQQEKELLGET